MGRTKALVAAVLLVPALAACSPSSEEKMVLACEEVLRERLLSPSGYKRVAWASLESERLTPEQFRVRYVDINRPSIPVDVSIAGTAEHTLHRATIEYDAPNAYGVLLRQHATCDLSTTDPSDFEMSWARHEVRVDGLSHLAWLKRR